MYPVLRRRNFVLLWVGGLVSSYGDWLLALALPFYLYQQTGSALASTALFMVNMLPRVLFGSVAGVFVDRWDHRRTMLITDLARAGLLLLLLPVASSDAWLWISYPIVALEATLSMFFQPARGALLPRLVPRDELLAANGLGSVSESAIRLLAPALGGVLVARFGLASVLLIDSASYLFSALMIALLRVPAISEAVVSATPAAASRWAAFWTEWLAGLRQVRRDHLLWTIFLVAGIVGVADGIVNPLLLVFVQDVLHADADVLGWMITATGIGTLLTGLVLGRAGPGWPPTRVVAWGKLLLGVVLLLTFLSRDSWVVVALSVPAGIGLASSVGFMTVLQSSVHAQHQGRVLGAFNTSGALLMLIGQALGSLVANQIGVLPILYAACSLFMLAGVLGLRRLPREPTVEAATSSGVAPEAGS